MQQRIRDAFAVLPAVMPIVFSMLFFGLLCPCYNVSIYTANIEGEGICTTYLCPQEGFAPFYERGFYFGSELRKATIEGVHWDVDALNLTISDVTAMELEGYDVTAFGIPIARYKIRDMVNEGDYDSVSAHLTGDGERVRFEFKDPAAGFSMNLVTGFAPMWFWVAYAVVMVVAALLASIVVGIAVKGRPKLLAWLYVVSGVLVSIVAGCFLSGSLPYVTYGNLLISWLLLCGVSFVLGSITLPWIGSGITMVAVLLWNTANHYVILFRGKPITPYDFAAIGTAREVAGGYDFTPSPQMIVAILVTAAYIVLCYFAWKVVRVGAEQKSPGLQPQLRPRLVTAVCGAVLIGASILSPVYQSLETFAWDAVLLKSYHEEGAVLSFLKAWENSGVKEPEGYSRDKVNGYLKDYLSQRPVTAAADVKRPTRIIMVMDEAFADLRTVGLNSNVDVMPFIDSLDQNTAEGRLYVSVFGGGTCNSEFEALTGNCMAFLGPGSYPYVEYVTRPVFSLADYFKANGYGTDAFHANEATNWNRDRVYPNLGFDTFHSIGDYQPLSQEQYLHSHPADVADYALIEQTTKQRGDKSQFLFCVTMQNHSGYERWEDVQEAQSVKDNVPDLYMDTRVYLSLVKASDDAVRQLVETYKDDASPTMIVYFGDHQPGLPEVARQEFYATNSFLDNYKTKFFVWTNYESQAQHDVQMSANYLPWLVLERGNFELPPYVKMLKEVHEKYPVISSQGVIDSDGNVYSGVDDEAIAGDPLIQKYRYIQYANLFDEIDSAWFKTGGSSPT